MSVRPTEIVSVIVAVIACFGAVVSALYSYLGHNREMDIELVKIGVGILRADPKETQTAGAREWAIEIIEKYSHQPFSAEAKRELLENSLGFIGYYDTRGYDSSYTPGDFSSRGGFGDKGRPRVAPNPQQTAPQSK